MNEKRALWLNRLELIVRIILGGLFIYAAVPKIMNPQDFAINIENYQIVSASVSHYTAMFLPWLELYCGILIIINCLSRYSAIILSILLIVFIIALFSVTIRGLEINCGCFSPGEEGSDVSWLRIVEDLILLSMAMYLIFIDYIRSGLLMNNKSRGV